MKGKIYKMAVKPAMIELEATTKRQEEELAELKMLRFTLGMTRRNRI